MKNTAPQTTTSLPRAPRDDAQSRMTRYFIMMSVRVVCFVLMVAVHPYGWYTWLFALGAVVLPYLAVIIANVAGGTATRAETPSRQLEAPLITEQPPATQTPSVLRIQESPPRRAEEP